MEKNCVSNPVYLDAFTELMTAINCYHLHVNDIQVYLNGFRVTFKEYPDGDILCHDGSYGNTQGLWESYGFPWDENDVTVQTAQEFCHKLAEVAQYGVLNE